MTFTTGLMFLLSATSFAGEPVLASSPHVDIKLGYQVVNREVEAVPADNVFVAGEAVIVWSALAGVPDGFIEHVWLREGVEVSRKFLPVGSNRRWRTWSRMTVEPGRYEVRVVGPDGTLLRKVAFVVAEELAGC